ncbi:MAG: PQQ-dependent sugar dehydrogenase [Erythrobacter sp.]|uniref:PQQ-dependent sugar dehydrogenase n=1 Tax=Erythrobacter sp. TaxID=1042 RepID=UPI0032646501
MNTFSKFALLTSSTAALALASCAAAEAGESSASGELQITQKGEFEKPWAIEFAPGTAMLFVTEKEGVLKVMDTANGTSATVAGAPDVAFGGQGGFGDIAFLPSETGESVDGRTIYLSWAEFGEEGETRGAVVGKGTLACASMEDCALEGLEVIWRQAPKVSGRGHYSHKITVSPDESHLFVTSGDRQKMTPSQDNKNTLGTIVRLNLDGTPAEGNPFADEGGVTAQIWSYGHRNLLGIDWDADGRLWDVEHGPAGGDELNLVKKAANYGWPTRSYGEHYNGDPIADHSADDGFEKPAIWWTPVIAPGDMQFYHGDMFADWQGDALITGLSSQTIVRVEIDGETATEAARYPIDGRVRSLDVAQDGSIWVATDEGSVLRLSM